MYHFWKRDYHRQHGSNRQRIFPNIVKKTSLVKKNMNERIKNPITGLVCRTFAVTIAILLSLIPSNSLNLIENFRVKFTNKN